MAVINHQKREINAKIVLYGPSGSGKGQLLELIHKRVKPELCGQLKTMPAGQDRLQFFDYTPFESSSLDGFRVRFHIYTITGEVTNPGTWKMTLKGVDGLMFVTGDAGIKQAVESLRSLRGTLSDYGRELGRLPRVWLSRQLEQGGAGLEPELQQCFGVRHSLCAASDGESAALRGLALLSQEVLQELRMELNPESDSDILSMVNQPVVQGDDQPAGPDEYTLPAITVDLDQPIQSLSIPLMIRSGGRIRRYNLSLTLQSDDKYC